MRLRIPPGRAGRLWLRERLSSARRAADLLDHKRRELESELHRMERILAQRARAWRDAVAEAERWLGRIDATGGARTLRIAAAMEPGSANVRLTWRQVMGVRYPTEFALDIPPAPDVVSLDGGAATTIALGGYRQAVEAAVAHAVARTALERVRTDMERTVRRLRALQLRAIPAHDEALRALEVRLDEKDREEAVAALWATGNATGTIDSGDTP